MWIFHCVKKLCSCGIYILYILWFAYFPQTIKRTVLEKSVTAVWFLVPRTRFTVLNENTSLMQSNKYIFHLSSVSTCFGQYIAHHQEINIMYKISIWCQTEKEDIFCVEYTRTTNHTTTPSDTHGLNLSINHVANNRFRTPNAMLIRVKQTTSTA